MKNKQSWIDQRFPLTKVWNEHLAEYYTPRNFNFWYFFGSLAILMLVMQFVTGIFLTMHFKPDSANAFASVEYIMRDVEWGWLVRYLHSVGASAFFVVIYLHMYRGLLYGSYKGPRELLWILGMLLYIVLMAEAFMGYVLPWGQMSFWGAQVIISLFGSVPVIGPDLLVWILGDYALGDAALNRFFFFACDCLTAYFSCACFLAPCRSSRGWLKQPRWNRDKEKQRQGRHPQRRHPVPPIFHR